MRRVFLMTTLLLNCFSGCSSDLDSLIGESDSGEQSQVEHDLEELGSVEKTQNERYLSTIKPGAEPGQIGVFGQMNAPFVWCPPGVLARKNQNSIILTEGFWIGRTEVTQLQWISVMKTSPWNDMPWTKEGGEYPATWISWLDANKFCSTLNEIEKRNNCLPEGWEYDLPTEVHWEYACRAGTETEYSYGDDKSRIIHFSWCKENTHPFGEGYAHPVSLKKPNPWGIYDLHGNVWEWCKDEYVDELQPKHSEQASGNQSRKAFRGGSWPLSAEYCGSGSRGGNLPTTKNFGTGFRVMLRCVH